MSSICGTPTEAKKFEYENHSSFAGGIAKRKKYLYFLRIYRPLLTMLDVRYSLFATANQYPRKVHPSVSTISTHCPIFFWITRKCSSSCGVTNEIARPVAPARPVRPMRWIKSLGEPFRRSQAFGDFKLQF